MDVQISNTRELVPLNNDLVNFQTQFHVESKTKEPFRALIVNQTELDENPNLQLRDAPKGIFSGSITENSNKKDNWYLILEADKEMQVHVDLKVAEIEPFTPEEPAAAPKKKWSLWWIFAIIAVVCIIGFVCYRVFFRHPAVAPAMIVAATPPPPQIVVAAPAEPVEPLDLSFSDLPPL